IEKQIVTHDAESVTLTVAKVAFTPEIGRSVGIARSEGGVMIGIVEVDTVKISIARGGQIVWHPPDGQMGENLVPVAPEGSGLPISDGLQVTAVGPFQLPVLSPEYPPAEIQRHNIPVECTLPMIPRILLVIQIRGVYNVFQTATGVAQTLG